MNAQRVQPLPNTGTVGFTAISELPQCAFELLSRPFPEKAALNSPIATWTWKCRNKRTCPVG